jgi:TonB family protein
MASVLLAGTAPLAGTGLEPYPLHPDGDRITGPVPIARTEPEPPPAAAERRSSAQVVLALEVDATGGVGRIEVLHATPPDEGFEEAALEAVRQWRYEPARKAGAPVAVDITVTVDFPSQRPVKISPRARWAECRERGLAAYESGDLRTAERRLRHGLEDARLMDKPGILLPASLKNLGAFLSSTDRPEEAIANLEEALPLYEKLLGASSAELVALRQEMGLLYLRLGRTDEARAQFRVALAVQAKASGETAALIPLLQPLARLALFDGTPDEAEAYLNRARLILEGADPADPLSEAANLVSLGRLYLTQERFEEAEVVLGKALGLRQGVLDEDDPLILEVRTDLSRAAAGKQP